MNRRDVREGESQVAGRVSSVSFVVSPSFPPAGWWAVAPVAPSRCPLVGLLPFLLALLFLPSCCAFSAPVSCAAAGRSLACSVVSSRSLGVPPPPPPRLAPPVLRPFWPPPTPNTPPLRPPPGLGAGAGSPARFLPRSRRPLPFPCPPGGPCRSGPLPPRAGRLVSPPPAPPRLLPWSPPSRLFLPPSCFPSVSFLWGPLPARPPSSLRTYLSFSGTSVVPVGQRRILRTSKKATAPTLGRGRCYLRFLQT